MRRTAIILSSLLLLLLGLVPAASAQAEGSCGRGPDDGTPGDGVGPPGQGGRGNSNAQGRGPETAPYKRAPGLSGQRSQNRGQKCQMTIKTENATTRIVFFDEDSNNAGGGTSGVDYEVEQTNGTDGGAQPVQFAAVAQPDGTSVVSVPLTAAAADGTIALAVTATQADGSSVTDHIVVDTAEAASGAGAVIAAGASDLGISAAQPQSAPQELVSALQERPADGYGLLALVMLLIGALGAGVFLRRVRTS